MGSIYQFHYLMLYQNFHPLAEIYYRYGGNCWFARYISLVQTSPPPLYVIDWSE